MELHAILNTSDDSSSDEVDGPSSFRFNEGSVGGPPPDIEQILREDDLDDDDEEEEDDDDDDDGFDGVGVSPAIQQSRFSWKTRAYSDDLVDPYINEPHSNDVNDSSPSPKNYSIKYSRNAEDWAVLQAILDEDNDEDDSEWLSPANTVTHASYQYHETLTLNPAAMHYGADDDDEADDYGGLRSDRLPSLPSLQIAPPTELSPEPRANEVVSTKNADESSGPDWRHNTIIDRKPNQSSDQRFGATTSGGMMIPPPPVAGLPETAIETADRMEEEMSRRAMSCAQAYERKLLRSGQHEIVSPLMVKRRLKPKFEMRARGATASAQQHSRTGLDKATMSTSSLLYQPSLPRFGSSAMVENVAMASVSESLDKHSATGAKVPCGLPTCLAFNSKFIAVGTQLGIILVYDLFEVLRQRLGAPTPEHSSLTKKAGSITSLDLSYNGEAVAAGYASGLLILWDTIRGVMLRAVSDAHPSPISAVRFLNELKMVTVDAGGLVNKLTFTRNILWSNYSMDTECLLDGTAGQILAMNVLSPFATVKPAIRPEPLAQALRRLTLIALSSERSSFVVAVEPRVHVLHRWARPPSDRTSPLVVDHAGLSESLSSSNTSEQVYLPCLSWGWGLVAGGGNMAMPILARAWACCVQLLVASFPTWEQDAAATVAARSGEEPPISWPAFGEHKEIDASAPVVAMEWLNERSLVYLTITNEFIMVDTVMMILLERLDFSGLKLVYAEFSLSRSSASAADSIDLVGPDFAICATFQNSIRCSDDRLAVLCRKEIRCLSIVSARRRISALEEDGEWLEALALALDHYESTVVSQEDRKRDQTGRRDLSRHPEFSMVKSEEEEWIAKLLIRYLNLAVENAPEPATEYVKSPALDASQTRIDLAQSHFQMLAGVCVEFCVAIRRLDLLFGSIFRRFQLAGYTSVFLDVLEPYVLSDKLSYIAPEAMAFFIEHCKARNGIATVERCLLHMDCTIMDFDSIISLLRANEMYTALVFVFNRGLDDYVTPLEIILERVFDEADAGGNLAKRRRDGVPQTEFERLGYKAIFFLQTCFNGRSFPQETELKPEDRQRTVKIELLQFLMKARFSPSPHVKKTTNFAPLVGQRTLEFPYVRVLLQVDAKAVLDTIGLALDTTDTLLVNQRAGDSMDGWVDETASKSNSSKRMPSQQEVLDMLSTIVVPQTDDQSKYPGKALFHFRNTGNAFLDFAAKYIMRGVVVDQGIIHMIVNRICNRYTACSDPLGRKSAQRQVMDLLSALPRDSYSPDKVLDLINRAGMHRAALQLHQQVASSWHEAGLDDIELRSRHFHSAIDCFIEDEDPVFRKDVFAYIKKECSGVVDNSNSTDLTHPKTLRDALYAKLPALVHLDALKTARLVAELLVDDMDQVVSSLESNDGGEGQFLFLHAVISGNLVQADPVAGSVLNPTMDHHYKYLSLMARLHPEMVYDYLSTHDNYRLEECLKLCQYHDIADASAYLLERMGNVSSALQLILQTLESRMMNLKRTIRSMGVDYREHSLRHSAGRPSFEKPSSPSGPTKHERYIDGVKRILIVALDLCERNSGSFATRSEHGSQLWFNVLDRLINAKGFLRLSKEQPDHAKTMEGVLSSLLRLTMQRMVSSVPLPDLVRKVTSDHSGSRLGELREMVESLLATYGFELTVFQNSVSIFHRDVHNMRKWQYRLQVEGSPVESLPKISANATDTGRAWRRSILQGVTLKVGANRSATLVDGARAGNTQHAENGFAHKLHRLRARRVGSRDAPGRSASSLNLMTVTELMFLNNSTDPVVDGPYLVGSLGEAVHRGRLMTFG